MKVRVQGMEGDETGLLVVVVAPEDMGSLVVGGGG
jgi:predicted RNA-binding protein YlqC (UPF0109 family)